MEVHSRPYNRSEFRQFKELVNTPMDISSERVLTMAGQLFEDLNTPTSLGLFLCMRHNDFLSIVSHTIDPIKYNDADEFLRSHQAVKLLAKASFLPLGVDTKAVARSKFEECESQCSRSNSRILLSRFTHEDELFISRVKLQIEKILGDFTISEVLDRSRLGPGLVAFGPKSKQHCIKLTRSVSVTGSLLRFLGTDSESASISFYQDFPGWFDNVVGPLRVVDGGKFTTVPKDARTDRCIETQPTVNLFLQLGFGQVIRERLKVAGIDLSDQTRNQRLARVGAQYGRLATIDLSNASDSIAFEVIRLLLPSKWFHALDAVRTKSIYFDNSWRKLERFSSMGNGFTFELETLIFTAIVRALNENCVHSVYGDDIVVPSSMYSSVASRLSFFGFTVNEKKSYHSGPFRESCGSDFFLGKQVRPYFLKEVPIDVSSIIRLANGLARAALRSSCGYGFDSRFKRAHTRVRSWIPAPLRSRLAFGYSSSDECLLMPNPRAGFRLTAKTISERPDNFHVAKAGMLYKIFVSPERTSNACPFVVPLSFRYELRWYHVHRDLLDFGHELCSLMPELGWVTPT